MAGEEGLVVLGEKSLLVAEERGEDGFEEGDVVGAWLATNLPQRILRIRPRQGHLVLVRQVEVVNAAD